LLGFAFSPPTCGRFVFATYPPEKLAEIMVAFGRWGMGREMQITELDQLALSIT
jgi:hypothetical protein